LFHPIRLALAGRAGEGELDRVILLLDEAAGAEFAVAGENGTGTILEFARGWIENVVVLTKAPATVRGRYRC